MNCFALSCLAALAAVATCAPARADFASCAEALRADGARAGVSRETLGQAFDGLQPDMKVLDFEKAQPEFKTPIWDYLEGLVDDERIADGKAAMAREARALAHAEQTYGVSRYMLAAIWGVESNFGAEMGERPLVRSLATLACFGERPGYFRSELMAALRIIDRGDIPADKLAGSWAGAFGQTQFMPSSYLRLAAPGSDGGRDIVDFGRRRARLDRPLLRQVGLAPGRSLGLRGPAAARLFRTLRPQGEGADVGLGGPRDHADRRSAAQRGRSWTPPARGLRRPRLPGDAQLRRGLFL